MSTGITLHNWHRVLFINVLRRHGERAGKSMELVNTYVNGVNAPKKFITDNIEHILGVGTFQEWMNNIGMMLSDEEKNQALRHAEEKCEALLIDSKVKQYMQSCAHISSLGGPAPGMEVDTTPTDMEDDSPPEHVETSEAPIQDVPNQGALIQGVSMQDVPVQSTPNQGAPLDNVTTLRTVMHLHQQKRKALLEKAYQALHHLAWENEVLSNIIIEPVHYLTGIYEATAAAATAQFESTSTNHSEVIKWLEEMKLV